MIKTKAFMLDWLAVTNRLIYGNIAFTNALRPLKCAARPLTIYNYRPDGFLGKKHLLMTY